MTYLLPCTGRAQFEYAWHSSWFYSVSLSECQDCLFRQAMTSSSQTFQYYLSISFNMVQTYTAARISLVNRRFNHWYHDNRYTKTKTRILRLRTATVRHDNHKLLQLTRKLSSKALNIPNQGVAAHSANLSTKISNLNCICIIRIKLSLVYSLYNVLLGQMGWYSDWTTEASDFDFTKLQDLSLFHGIETGSRAHSASYLMGTGAFFPMGKTVRAWNWPLTSFTWSWD